jgi:hypothetical protein
MIAIFMRRPPPAHGARQFLAPDTVIEIEDALEPGRHHVARLEHRCGGDDAGPLEHAEQDVIGIGRRIAAEEAALLKRLADRLQAAAELLQRLPALARKLLERFLEEALDLGAQMLGIRLVHAIEHVAHQVGYERRNELAVGVKMRQRFTDRTTEQAGSVGERALEIARDRPGIGDDAVVVLEDRNLALSAEGDRGLVADRDRVDDEGEALVMQRKPRAPGECAEPAIVEAAKLPKLEHLHLRKVQSILRRTFNESRWRPIQSPHPKC